VGCGISSLCFAWLADVPCAEMLQEIEADIEDQKQEYRPIAL
jgi:hypothetical protein